MLVGYMIRGVVPVFVEEFLGGWLSWLELDGLLVGVNWAGLRASGFDLTPAQVIRWFAETEVAVKRTTRQ
jgi:hypothetical protein